MDIARIAETAMDIATSAETTMDIAAGTETTMDIVTSSETAMDIVTSIETAMDITITMETLLYIATTVQTMDCAASVEHLLDVVEPSGMLDECVVEKAAIPLGNAEGDNSQLEDLLLKVKKPKTGVRHFFSHVWKTLKHSALCWCCCVCAFNKKSLLWFFETARF
ncbi:hypothetical protein AAFF_G00337570 [Aldrovandia affinis]|uniref:Uncharacterized protein n=1 Tax=Aldrovandia affinis TaxID=143900 RepID=A0AAD7WPR0_9TELE|nr:hypothetical protein AAFF_G00337570 [Aldrovandia affinis]